MTTYQLSEPFEKFTDGNHGPAVVVSSLLCIIIAAITVITRLVTRLRVSSKFVIDDALVTVALIVGIIQTACLIRASDYGIGRYRDSLSPQEYSIFAKAFYASDILILWSLCFAKSSVAYLIAALRPPTRTRWVCYALTGIIFGWAITGSFATAFRCQLPKAYDVEGKCVNIAALDLYNFLMNVLTDAGLIALAAYLMVNVQVAQAKKWLVIGAFASRAIVIIFAIFAIATRRAAINDQSSDFTRELVMSSIYQQLMLAFSIMTACLPSIRRFLTELKTGMMGVQISAPLEHTMRNTSSNNDSNEAGNRSQITSATNTVNEGTHRKLSQLSFRRSSKSKTRSSAAFSNSIDSPQQSKSKSEMRDNKNRLSQFCNISRSSVGSNRLSNSQQVNNTDDPIDPKRRVERSDSKRRLTKNAGIILQTIDYEVESEYEEEEEETEDNERHSPSQAKSSSNTLAAGIASNPSTRKGSESRNSQRSSTRSHSRSCVRGGGGDEIPLQRLRDRDSNSDIRGNGQHRTLHVPYQHSSISV